MAQHLQFLGQWEWTSWACVGGHFLRSLGLLASCYFHKVYRLIVEVVLNKHQQVAASSGILPTLLVIVRKIMFPFPLLLLQVTWIAKAERVPFPWVFTEPRQCRGGPGSWVRRKSLCQTTSQQYPWTGLLLWGKERSLSKHAADYMLSVSLNPCSTLFCDFVIGEQISSRCYPEVWVGDV